jgi:hypothetical protein
MKLHQVSMLPHPPNRAAYETTEAVFFLHAKRKPLPAAYAARERVEIFRAPAYPDNCR